MRLFCEEELFAKIVNIAVDRLVDDLDRLFPAADLVDGGFLIFQVFVDGEEVTHLLKDVPRELVDVGVLIIGGIAEGNGDDLGVVSAVIDHRNDPDGVGAHEHEGLDGLRAKEKHVEGVVVLAIGAGDKAVVGGIVRRGMKDTVKLDQARFLVKLILFLASLGDLDNANEVAASDALGGNIVPNIRHFFTLSAAGAAIYSKASRLVFHYGFIKG